MAHHVLKAEINRFRVSLIELHGAPLPASPSHRLHRRTSTTSLAYIGNGDICAGGRKSLRNCSPNVAGASRHERDFSAEIHGTPKVRTSVDTQQLSIVYSSLPITATTTGRN